jgi:hypothetical protein
MNALATHPIATYAAPTRSTARRGFRWRWFMLTLGGLTTLAAVFFITLLLSFRMGGEARAVRNAVFAATPNEWSPKIELGIGRIPAWLARTGFHLFESRLDLPPEARFGVDAFRCADVGVYQRRRSAASSSPGAMFADVDQAMDARDWEPIVAVQEDQQSVRIFVPKDLSNFRDAQACVFILERDELVIVSARLNLEPLLELASSKLHQLPFPR